jgi:hypothetical protein
MDGHLNGIHTYLPRMRVCVCVDCGVREGRETPFQTAADDNGVSKYIWTGPEREGRAVDFMKSRWLCRRDSQCACWRSQECVGLRRVPFADRQSWPMSRPIARSVHNEPGTR